MKDHRREDDDLRVGSATAFLFCVSSPFPLSWLFPFIAHTHCGIFPPHLHNLILLSWAWLCKNLNFILHFIFILAPNVALLESMRREVSGTSQATPSISRTSRLWSGYRSCMRHWGGASGLGPTPLSVVSHHVDLEKHPGPIYLEKEADPGEVALSFYTLLECFHILISFRPLLSETHDI